MPLPDKVAVAHKINEFLGQLVSAGGFKLKYRITVDPQFTDDRQNWERPEILVELAGPDSAQLLDRGAELLRSFEMLTHEALKLGPDEHELISFDCRNYRASRLSELKAAAQVAAERVRKTGMPYQFGAMSSRERRIVHLALRDQADLVTESVGAGPGRAVVVYPKDYTGKRIEQPMQMSRSRR